MSCALQARRAPSRRPGKRAEQDRFDLSGWRSGVTLPVAMRLAGNGEAIENPWRAFLMAFDREEPEFCRNAAIRREIADPAAGRDHPMARHDGRIRVSCERLPNGASRARGTGPVQRGRCRSSSCSAECCARPRRRGGARFMSSGTDERSPLAPIMLGP